MYVVTYYRNRVTTSWTYSVINDHMPMGQTENERKQRPSTKLGTIREKGTIIAAKTAYKWRENLPWRKINSIQQACRYVVSIILGSIFKTVYSVNKIGHNIIGALNIPLNESKSAAYPK